MKARRPVKVRGQNPFHPFGRRWFGSDRSRNVHRVREELERDGYPRLQMGLIVALTGGAGFGFSYALLQMGWHNMALRYPLSLGLAYLFFFFLIWLWLRTTATDWVDGGVDLSDVPRGLGGDGGQISSGGGGDFGGGGASGSFDSFSLNDVSNPVRDALGSVDIGLDADELAIPLALIALIAGIAFASLYVVYVAPAMLAEVLVDGAISYALYRRLRHQERRHWLSGVFRHTVWPFVVTGVFLAGAGWGMAVFAPGAQSIGQVMAHERAPH
jgi:hypothetical protein